MPTRVFLFHFRDVRVSVGFLFVCFLRGMKLFCKNCLLEIIYCVRSASVWTQDVIWRARFVDDEQRRGGGGEIYLPTCNLNSAKVDLHLVAICRIRGGFPKWQRYFLQYCRESRKADCAVTLVTREGGKRDCGALFKIIRRSKISNRLCACIFRAFALSIYAGDARACRPGCFVR